MAMVLQNLEWTTESFTLSVTKGRVAAPGSTPEAGRANGPGARLRARNGDAGGREMKLRELPAWSFGAWEKSGCPSQDAWPTPGLARRLISVTYHQTSDWACEVTTFYT